MATARMRHRDLGGRVIEVSALAVPHHLRAGWEVVEDDRPPAVEKSEGAGKRRSQKGSE